MKPILRYKVIMVDGTVTFIDGDKNITNELTKLREDGYMILEVHNEY